MLGSKGIISFSPELGDSSDPTRKFYPDSDAIITIILTDLPMIKLLYKNWMMPQLL